MSQEREIQDSILKAIDTVVKNFIGQLGFNYYKDGKIVAINLPYYTVEIDQENYTMKARTGLTLNIGDIIQVMIKNGDWSRKFIDDKRLI